MLSRNNLIKLLDTAVTNPNFNLNLLPASGFAVRFRFNEKNYMVPKPGSGYFRRKIHYPEEYTLKPIPYTNMGGRDPVTGRIVVGTLGGGIKHPLLWVDYTRHVPEGETTLVEKVLEVFPEPTRTAHVALVGANNRCRYIIATENMKPGDLITTSNELTKIAVRPNEGDAYPVGSLSINTVVSCIEAWPGSGGVFSRAAGTSSTIVRKIGDRVIILRSGKKKMETSVLQTCMAVVGRVSNKEHSSIHIGSPNNLRALGYRPRSGWWQRKSGKHGRKNRRPPPCVDMVYPDQLPKKPPRLHLTLEKFPYHWT